MSDFGVGLDRKKKLAERMVRLGVREEDIIESFIKSAKPGGQNVNKTSTCVYLKHTPTGIEVKCQRERSQRLNRIIAREILLEKIEEIIRSRLLQERQRIEKIKRQKRKRSKRAQLKMLEIKRRHSQKKQLRARIRAVAFE